MVWSTAATFRFQLAPTVALLVYYFIFLFMFSHQILLLIPKIYYMNGGGLQRGHNICCHLSVGFIRQDPQ